ncbi:MAG: hypothetical protein K2X68_13215 [Novosphingobium sp.]|nr:hypothetical protein [Novosphingobium sp.]
MMLSAWRIVWSILLGGVLMPLIGFALLSALTFLPLAALVLAPRLTIIFLYMAGFVPSIFTAAAHAWLRRHPLLPQRTFLAALVGAATCVGWYGVLGIAPGLGWSQIFYSLIAAVSSAIYFRLTLQGRCNRGQQIGASK